MGVAGALGLDKEVRAVAWDGAVDRYVAVAAGEEGADQSRFCHGSGHPCLKRRRTRSRVLGPISKTSKSSRMRDGGGMRIK